MNRYGQNDTNSKVNYKIQWVKNYGQNNGFLKQINLIEGDRVSSRCTATGNLV